MVTTRRQSKTIEPPALSPVAPPKRKRNNEATTAQRAAQLTKHPSNKRRKIVKSTSNVLPPVVTPTTSTSNVQNEKTRTTSKTAKRKACMETTRTKATLHPNTYHKRLSNSQNLAPPELSSTSNSNDNEAPTQAQHVTSHDAHDEDADSRYTFTSKRKKTARPRALPAWPTAELKFEEDGLEKMDNAQATTAETRDRTSAQKNSGPGAQMPLKEGVTAKLTNANIPQVDAKGKGLDKEDVLPVDGKVKGKVEAAQREMRTVGVPSKIVMFTVIEAIAALSLYKDGSMSIAAEIDPKSRQPYRPLKTGEYLSYPVKGNYHLGGLGHYGTDAKYSTPFSLTVPLTSNSFVESTATSSYAGSSRHGLGFATLSVLPAGSKSPLLRRPSNYCFTFGRYRGRRMDSVPISYLRSIFQGDEYYADAKLLQAFTDLYPKGLYESEAESFTFEKGGFKGKRLDEVPKSYLWGLIRKKNAGEDVSGKKGRGRLERALEAWERGQLDLTKD